MAGKIEKNGEVVVVHMPERVDSTNAAQLEAEVFGCLEGGSNRVVFEFAGLDYISSAGLRVVLTAAKRIKAAQGRMAICALRPHIREVFDISGFLAILNVHDDSGAAIAFAQG